MTLSIVTFPLSIVLITVANYGSKKLRTGPLVTVASHIRLFARLWADQRPIMLRIAVAPWRVHRKSSCRRRTEGHLPLFFELLRVTVVGSNSKTYAEATMIKVLNLTESRKINAFVSSKMINCLIWGQSQVQLGKSPSQVQLGKSPSQVQLGKSPPRSRRAAPRRL